MINDDVKSFTYKGVEYVEVPNTSNQCDGCAFQYIADCSDQRWLARLVFGRICFPSSVVYLKKQPLIEGQNSSSTSSAEEIYRAEIAAKQAIIDQLTTKLDAVRSALEN
jgi:hypothetical protein